MNCPYCKTELAEGATVCPSCRAYLETVQKGGGLAAVATGCIGFLIVLVGWGALFGLCLVLLDSGIHVFFVWLLGFVGFFAIPFIVNRFFMAIVPKKTVWISQR